MALPSPPHPRHVPARGGGEPPPSRGAGPRQAPGHGAPPRRPSHGEGA
uniref:Uncharacterized protein n=1 Tax=Arundo donax TaxID=35708 RepID=A0A0A9A055_ARUDO